MMENVNNTSEGFLCNIIYGEFLHGLELIKYLSNTDKCCKHTHYKRHVTYTKILLQLIARKVSNMYEITS